MMETPIGAAAAINAQHMTTSDGIASMNADCGSVAIALTEMSLSRVDADIRILFLYLGYRLDRQNNSALRHYRTCVSRPLTDELQQWKHGGIPGEIHYDIDSSTRLTSDSVASG